MKLKKIAFLLLLISQLTVAQDLNSLKVEAQKLFDATKTLVPQFFILLFGPIY